MHFFMLFNYPILNKFVRNFLLSHIILK